jgi:hypothetical protein
MGISTKGMDYPLKVHDSRRQVNMTKSTRVTHVFVMFITKAIGLIMQADWGIYASGPLLCFTRFVIVSRIELDLDLLRVEADP